MKKILTYSFTLLLAAFFLLAGTGVNYVHYCCETCRAAGIEHVMAESCEAIHEHTHHHHDANCHHENGCQMQRLQLSQTVLSNAVEIPTTIDFTTLLCPILAEPLTAYSLEAYTQTTIPIYIADIPLNGRSVSIQDCSFLL